MSPLFFYTDAIEAGNINEVLTAVKSGHFVFNIMSIINDEVPRRRIISNNKVAYFA